MAEHQDTNQLVDHLFRHEAGKMISILTRLFGLHQLELAEDVVQEAFLKAAQTWTYQEIPNNPAAWLMQVAKNKAIDILRRGHYAAQYSRAFSRQAQQLVEETVEEFFHENEIADSQLQLIFACCHPSLNPDDQLAFTLKTASGFGAAEIAKALVTNEHVIQKRLYRARQFLKEQAVQLEIPAGQALNERLENVYTVLYLIFNEGYNSIKADELIRKDLCAEAMRLCRILSEHKCGARPMTFALLSLMCFQASRFESRIDENNTIVLLQEQDRKKWNKELISLGYQFLSQSSYGDEISIYHLEAAIAAEHCLSPNFESTNWERLLGLYDLLLQLKKTTVVQLNRSVVLAQTGHAGLAIEEINQIPGLQKLIDSQYIYSAVLGDLYLQTGNADKAKEMLGKAYTLTQSQAEKKLIAGKLSAANSAN